MTFDDILAKLELSMLDFVVKDPANPNRASEAFVKVYEYLTAVHAKVTAKPVVDPNAPKPVANYVKVWEQNTTAKVKADKVVDTLLGELAKYENDPAVLFHLRNGAKETLVKYLVNEVDWQEHLQDKALAAGTVKVSGGKSDLATEYLEGKAGLAGLYKLVGHTLTVPGEMIAVDKKDKAPNLPGLPGNYGGTAAGANAKVYRLSYMIDGNAVAGPKEAVRALWTGKDRVGKTTTDLALVLDKHAKKVYGSDTPIAFKFNGHEVLVGRLPS